MKEKLSLKSEDSVLINKYSVDQDSHLVVRIPDIENDEDSHKNIFLLVDMACSIHAVSFKNVKFVKDKTLGSGKFTIPKQLQKITAAITASTKDPNNFAGVEEKWSNGYMLDFITVLASGHVLSKKGEYLSKVTYKDTIKKPLTFGDCQKKINIASTVGVDKDHFAVKFVKASFKSCIKESNTGFPGAWIKHAKDKNQVKTVEGLLAKMGWIPVCPPINKTEQVILHGVKQEYSEDKKKVTKNTLFSHRKENVRLNAREFRAAVALTLPLLSESSTSSVADQLKKGKYKITPSTLKTFKEQRRAQLVDSLNKSYTLFVSIGNKKSKTREIHYKISRDVVLNKALNLELISASGKKYPKFSDMPKEFQDSLRSFYKYPLDGKLTSETSKGKEPQAETDTPMEDVSAKPAALTRAKRVKKSKPG
jgi:hypothetical protein